MVSKEDRDDMVTIVALLAKHANILGNPSKKVNVMVENFVREHPTIQQGIVRMISVFAKQVSDMERHVDGRNEQSVKWLKQASEIDVPLPII